MNRIAPHSGDLVGLRSGTGFLNPSHLKVACRKRISDSKFRPEREHAIVSGVRDSPARGTSNAGWHVLASLSTVPRPDTAVHNKSEGRGLSLPHLRSHLRLYYLKIHS